MRVTIRKKKITGGKHSLFLDVTGHGRHKEYLKLFVYDSPKDHIEKLHNEETMRMAKAACASRQLELQAADIGQKYVPRTSQTFEQHFDELVRINRNADYRKLLCARSHFKAFIRGKSFHLSESFVDGFKKYLLKDAGLKGETPSMYFRKFRAVCVLAYKKRIVKINPDEFDWSMKFDRYAFRKQVLTEGELRAMAKAECGNEKVKRMFLFMASTGLRFGDCKALRWVDITDGKLSIEQGKTGQYLHATLNATALKMVGRQPKGAELVFEYHGKHDAFSKVLRYWAKRAGIKKRITPHTARHTFCTLLMKNKVDHRTIIGLMGWSESSGMRQLLRYAHLVDDKAREAVDGLPVL